MRRRLDLASALIGRPRLLFLDEPTTGLDPRSRLGMWDVIRDLVREGTTLLLTTQYLEEADQLADKIVVVDHGRVIARGTADELKAQVGGERIEVVVHTHEDVPRAVALLAPDGAGTVDEHTRRLTCRARRRSAAGRGRPPAGRRGHRDRRHRPAPADPRRRVPHPDRPRGRADARRSRCRGRDGDRVTPRRQAATDGLVVAWRNLKRIPRIPELAIFAILQSIMFVLLFAFVFGGAIPLPGGGSYREYLMPGIFAQTIVFASITTAIGMADDMKKGLIDRFRSLPMARSAVLSGRTTPTSSTTPASSSS